MQKLEQLRKKFRITGSDRSRRVIKATRVCDGLALIPVLAGVVISAFLCCKTSERLLKYEKLFAQWINGRLSGKTWRDEAFHGLYSWLVPGVVVVGFLAMIWTFYLLMSEGSGKSDIIRSGWTCLWFILASLALAGSIFVIFMGWILPLFCCWAMMLVLAVPFAVINKELR